MKVIASHHEAATGTVGSYVTGFVLSLLITLAAYVLAAEKLTSGWSLVYALGGLAVAQLMVQLVCFLHLGRESKPFWNLQVLIFAVGVVIIVVFGSLWIMNNLNYAHHEHPAEAEIIKDEGY